MVKLGDSEPVGACADTGAEVSLISTELLHRAKVAFDWASLSDGYPVKGIGPTPQNSKTMITKLTFLHESYPLTITVALSVIDSIDYRFLIGRDILRPLKYRISDEGLSLTAPKSGKVTLFPYAAASAFSLS